jgi:quinoprotein glucose dehydrogenase
VRASTGTPVWHFQAVHHDLWDYDLPAMPALVTIHRGGQDIPAVIQATKMGHLFMLNRETGESLFPIEERPVPPSDVPGEQAWPSQPFPVAPAPLVPQSLTPGQAYGISPWDREACRQQLAALRADGIFTPPSLQGTLLFPGDIGGANWSGVSTDPERGLLVVNTNTVARAVWLIPRDQLAAERGAHPNAEIAAQVGTPYGLRRETLLSPIGLPCNPPPWGRLVAIDLASGEKRWDVPLGTLEGRMPGPLAALIGQVGTPNLGGGHGKRAGLHRRDYRQRHTRV